MKIIENKSMFHLPLEKKKVIFRKPQERATWICKNQRGNLTFEEMPSDFVNNSQGSKSSKIAIIDCISAG